MSAVIPLHAQGTAFTYQGRLVSNGNPATGNFDFGFKLYADPLGNTQLGASYLTNAIPATNGLFVTTIDFGAGIFTGATNWLEVDVRTNGAASYTVLSPLQGVTPTPNAIFAAAAGSVSGAVAAAQISGTLGNAVLPASPNFSGTVTAGVGFAGSGANVTNVNATLLNGKAATNFWQTGGNVGTSPTNGNFIGTTDNQPLLMKVNGQQVMRYEPTFDTPNVIGGYSGNFVQPGLAGATIAGGGDANGNQTNSIISGGHFGTIAGGSQNTVTAYGGAILGGSININGGYLAGLGAGQFNTQMGGYSWLGGGYQNTINSGGSYSTIGGGFQNTVTASLSGVTIGGGAENAGSGTYGTISGGYGGVASANFATVGGGNGNKAGGAAATVGGGNVNQATGTDSTVPGGTLNLAGGQFSFAAGYNAQASYDGSFVWADSQAPPFAATATNQFNVRAKGGVRLVTTGVGMTIDGQPALTIASASLGISLQQNTNGAPNVIEGSQANYVSNGVVGATISGGGATNYGGFGHTNSVTGDFGTVGGGVGNTSGGLGATVGGGLGNTSSGIAATVSGGEDNAANGGAAVVGGGIVNLAGADYSTVGGGSGNQATNQYATVPGGQNNVVSGEWGTVGGGFGNIVSGAVAVVAGGNQNFATGANAAVGGGLNNVAANSYATVPGGLANTASGLFATVGGGNGVTVSGIAATVAGGEWNKTYSTSDHAFIGGGKGNEIFQGSAAVIVGGSNNLAQAEGAVVGGGFYNQAGSFLYGGILSTVAGGANNYADGSYAAIAGGANNTVSGYCAFAAGGIGNNADGDYSFAAGRGAQAENNGSFVWADSQNADFDSGTNDEFIVRAANGVGINTTLPQATLHIVQNTSTLDYTPTLALENDGSPQVSTFYYYRTNVMWTDYVTTYGPYDSPQLSLNGYVTINYEQLTMTGDITATGEMSAKTFRTISDRNLKTNFVAIIPGEVLSKVAALPITIWNFKADDTSLHHLGPMAQDFYAAFGLGQDDKHLATVDEEGVALAAIQGLNEKLNQKLEQKETEITELKQGLADLKQQMQSLIGNK